MFSARKTLTLSNDQVFTLSFTDKGWVEGYQTVEQRHYASFTQAKYPDINTLLDLGLIHDENLEVSNVSRLDLDFYWGHLHDIYL